VNAVDERIANVAVSLGVGRMWKGGDIKVEKSSKIRCLSMAFVFRDHRGARHKGDFTAAV
jgi:hypothetical protein